MRIEGSLKKSQNYWAVSIPLLLIFTQGKTKKEAYAMAKEAVELLVEEKDFKVNIHPGESNFFSISSNNDSKLMSFALKQQRLNHELSIRDVASRLGSTSPTAYSRYEKGHTKPSLDKFSELLRAIDLSLEPILKV